MAVIACVDLDPFLVAMIRRVRPGDDVRSVTAGDVTHRPLPRTTVVIAPAGGLADEALEGPLGERTILVTGSHEPAVPATHKGPVLRRPVEAADLRLSLAALLPPGRLAQLRTRFGLIGEATSPDGAFAIARVGTVAAAVALDLTTGMSRASYGLIALLVAWTTLRIWMRDSTSPLVVGDSGLAVVAIALTGGPDSSYVLFGAACAAEVGYTLPPRVGASAIGAATLAGLVPLSLGLRDGTRSAAELVTWGLLVPLSGLAGVLADRIRRSERRDQVRLLEDVNSTLDRLARQAQGVAGTLERSSVVEQVLATIREDLAATSGVVLLGEDEVVTVAGSFGLRIAAPSRMLFENGDRDTLPADLASRLPAGERIDAVIRRHGIDRGRLVAVLADGTDRRAATQALHNLATEAAVAIDNARVFEGIRELTIDGERRRLARDLHDGVIQSLVHVGFELDLVGRDLGGEAAGALSRLRDVVGRTVEEVRATVNDLQSVRLHAGLEPALHALGNEYTRPGLTVEVDAGPQSGLTPEGELQVLRIAQEAVSNAVHHGQATAVVVRLWETETSVHLQVIDDGVGMDAVPADGGPGRGVGLRAMKERADLLGAHLDLGPGADGGTCVQVDVPTGSDL